MGFRVTAGRMEGAYKSALLADNFHAFAIEAITFAFMNMIINAPRSVIGCHNIR
jgi:hypothetical protein